MIQNSNGRYGYNELIHETKGSITHSYTKWVDTYPNITDKMYDQLSSYLYNLPSIQLGFESYKEDYTKGRVNGSCIKIEALLENEYTLLDYINRANNFNQVLLVLDYLLKY